MESEDIKKEIAKTRREMNETLAAIQRKLSPRYMAQDALVNAQDKIVRGAELASTSANQVQQQIQKQVERKPVQTVLLSFGAGVAVAWGLRRIRG